MPEDVQAQPAESSAAATVVEVPAEQAAYDHWRQTGEVKPKAESAPAKKSSDSKPVDAGDKEGSQESGEAPESDTGNKPQKSKAEARLNELLADLREAGLSPKELKSFKQNYRRAESERQEPAKAAAEKTENPPATEGLKAPAKPKESDFKTWEEYEAAKEKYFDELTDYKAQKAIADYQQKQAQVAAERDMRDKVSAAKQRYGDEAESAIVSTAKTVFNDKAIPEVIRAVAGDSPVLVDLMYTLGSKPEELAEFVELSRTNPSQALRKLVLTEKLVMEELKKAPAASDDNAPGRDATGKFVSSAKPATKAPPPPKETSGRSGAPPDPLASAIERGDFAAFRDAANRRDLAARRGQ